MSSKNRGGGSQPFDDYPSPSWSIDRFIEAVDLPSGGTWLEPCAGEGRIIQRVNRQISGITWHAWDIQEKYRQPLEALGATVEIVDMLSRAIHSVSSADVEVPRPPCTRTLGVPLPFDVIITNPSYSIAMEALLTARRLAPIVVLLLRRNFIGSAKRHKYLSRNMPDEYLLPDRPSFIWSHTYKAECLRFAHRRTFREKVPAGQRARLVGDDLPELCEGCGGQLFIKEVSTCTSDSAEYAWVVWHQRTGPVGKTHMLALTPPEERARR